jgi:uncharacterized protein YqcC (DUF446 family)
MDVAHKFVIDGMRIQLWLAILILPRFVNNLLGSETNAPHAVQEKMVDAGACA